MIGKGKRERAVKSNVEGVPAPRSPRLTGNDDQREQAGKAGRPLCMLVMLLIELGARAGQDPRASSASAGLCCFWMLDSVPSPRSRFPNSV